MNFQNWRRFAFFDKDVVKDPDNHEEEFAGLQGLNIVSTASGQGQIFLGESTGGVYTVEKHWGLNFFKAHNTNLQSLAYVKKDNILVTVGADETGVSNALLKIWSLSENDKQYKQGTPFCCRIIKVSVSNRLVKVTTVAVHQSLQFMAVGFEDSTVLLYKGDIRKEKLIGRPQLLRDGLVCASEGSISGLAFNGTVSHLNLFVITPTQVVTYTVGAKDSDSKNLMAHHGCTQKCWALGDPEIDHQLIIARSDAVYCYQPPDLQSQCYAFEGEKLMIKSAGCYLVIVSRDARTMGINENLKMNMVTIYDLPNSLIAYSAPIPEVMEVVHEWGAFYAITRGGGKVFQLKEKDTKSKLDILFRKNLYDVAISLAKRQHYSEERLSEIFKQYGDYLYQKNDYQNAISQYIKTIGKLEASFVIRKFLDSQRLPQLTLYLEALHKMNLANEDHTTILLNCYTKQTDTKKLKEFVEKSAKEVYFDVDTAIRVLRGANYTSDALFLAKLHRKHDSVLHILLEDKTEYLQAITYIRDLDFEQAEQTLKQYGKVLLSQVPDETTAFLKLLCTGYKSTGSDEVQSAPADQFIHIFVNDSKRLQEFLEHMISVAPDCSPLMYNTVLELYLRDFSRFDEVSKLSREDLQKRSALEEKIMRFLESPAQYELDHALILCQTHKFHRGLLHVYEKANLFQQILQHHIANKDHKKVIETCKKHGTDSVSREMWLQALWCFARSDDCPAECVAELLHHIDQLGVIPPLMVLEILSNSPTITLAVVKNYLVRWLTNENAQIQAEEAMIDKYKEEIQKTESVIENLRSSGQIFQVAKCSACDHALEVPTVHFLCKHSYHQHCFESYAESENECPACLTENKQLRNLLSAQKPNKDSYQSFKAELERSRDSITTVAEYFGRGLFQTQNFAAFLSRQSSSAPSRPEPNDGQSSMISSRLSKVAAKVAPPSTNPFDEED